MAIMRISRRQFIEGVSAATVASTGVAAESSARAAKHGKPANLSDIDHIVVLMKENRSFDHYFGSLRGVRGFDDPTAKRADGTSTFRQVDNGGSTGFVLPFHVDTHRTSAQRYYDLDHSWKAQHASWNGGAVDNWVATHRMLDGADGPFTMGYLTRADLPFYYALADEFTICDGYHCSALGPTHVNRFYLMTGTIDPEARFGGPAINNAGRAYSWETYPERLERAGISWRVYHDNDDYGCNVCRYFIKYQQASTTSSLYHNAMQDRPLYELLWDIKTGNIPQITWIVPPSNVTEHPDYLSAAGEDHTNQILQALWSNPKLWAKTAVILNYDENDGLFDHVTPPTPEPETPGEFVGGLPIGLGFRVPCMVISAFSRGGYVCGQTFDHTSILRLIEARFGVEVPNLSKWRRDNCGDLTAAFGFGEPPRFDIPTMPETEHALRLAEARAMGLPSPVVPIDQRMPSQEPGSRQRRA
jgi:phospholipase C